MFRRNDYIAVFDSGVGGVSVLRQLRRILPKENFYYYGDSANAPYGVRSTEEVRELTLAAVEHMMEKRPVKAIVVACNTATAAAIEALREKYRDMAVIGIEPAVKLAFDRHPGEAIGIMATAVTLREEKLAALLHRLDPDETAVRIFVPGLVELVESGRADSPEMERLLRQHLGSYAGRLRALVLGCTHYPLAKRAISSVMGEDTDLVDGGEGTARETRRRLAEKDLLNDSGGTLIIENSRSENVYLAEQLLKSEE